MNNYLASIASRTLNPASSVRPRLGGRFELASGSSQSSIDRAERSRPAAPNPPQPDLKRDTASAKETTEQHEAEGPQEQAFDLAPQLGRSAPPTPEVNPEPATVSLTSGANVDRPRPVSNRAATQQTIAEPDAQNVHVEVRPVENAIDSSQSSASRNQSLLESRRQNRSEVPLQTFPSRLVIDDQQPGVEEGTPTSKRRSSAATKSVASENDGLETLAKPVIAQPVITREKPVIERELETIIIREKPTLDETARHNQSQSAPMSVASLSQASEDEGSKASPIVVQSRIAPLLETGPEHSYLNRPSSQPQPTVHVTIGRIEVRAVQSSQPPTRSRAATPVMNLDDYLTRRNQGGAR